MKGIRKFLFTYGVVFGIALFCAGYSGDASAFICDSTLCIGQPLDYGPLGGSCDGAPWGVVQCGKCYCDGANSSYCHPNEGTACPTPTPFPTPTPGPALSFTFSPNSAAFGDVTLNGMSGGVTVTVTNVSSVNGASCLVTPDDDTSFDVLNGSCGTINAGASCNVIIKGHPEALGYYTGRLCIRCTGMPICPIGPI